MNVYNLAKCLAIISGINLMGFAVGMESDPPLSCDKQKEGQNNNGKTTIVFGCKDGNLEIDCYKAMGSDEYFYEKHRKICSDKEYFFEKHRRIYSDEEDFHEKYRKIPSDDVEEDKQESDKVKKNKQKVQLGKYHILNVVQYIDLWEDLFNLVLVDKKWGEIIRNVKAVRPSRLKFNLASVNEQYGATIRNEKAVKSTALEYEERVNPEVFLTCTQLPDIIEGKKRITRYIPVHRSVRDEEDCKRLYLDSSSFYIFQNELVSYIWTNNSKKITPMNSVESIVLQWDHNFILDIDEGTAYSESELYSPIHNPTLVDSSTEISFLNILAIIGKYFPQVKTIVLDGFQYDDISTIEYYIYDDGFINVFKTLEDKYKTIFNVLNIAKTYFPDIDLNSDEAEVEIFNIWENNGKRKVVDGAEVKTIDDITLNVFLKTIQELKECYKSIILEEDLIKFEVLYNAYIMLSRLALTANKTAEEGKELKLTYRTIVDCMLDNIIKTYKYFSWGEKNSSSKKRIIQFKTFDWCSVGIWDSFNKEVKAVNSVIKGTELKKNAGPEENFESKEDLELLGKDLELLGKYFDIEEIKEYKKTFKSLARDLEFNKRYVEEEGFSEKCRLREKYLSFKGHIIKTLFNQLKDQALRSAISLHPDSCKKYFNLAFLGLFAKGKEYEVVYDDDESDENDEVVYNDDDVVYNYVDFRENNPDVVYNKVFDFCVNKIILIYFQKDKYLDLKMEYKNYPTGRYYQDAEKAANNRLIELQEKIKKRCYQNDEKTTNDGLIKLQKKILERGYEDLFDKVFNEIKNEAEKYDNLIQQIVDKILRNESIDEELKELYNAIISEDSYYTYCISRTVLNGSSFSKFNAHSNYPAINPATEDKYNIVTDQPRVGGAVFVKNNSNTPNSYSNLANKYKNFTPKIKVLWDILELQTTHKFVREIFDIADELINAVLEQEMPALPEILELIKLESVLKKDFTSFERESIYDFVQFARAVIIAKAAVINREKPVCNKKTVYIITNLKNYIDRTFGFSNNTADNPYPTPDVNRLLSFVDYAIDNNIFLNGSKIDQLIEQLAHFVLKFMFLNKEKDAEIYCKLEVDDD